jgi:4-amino-4-deoxy-L-arabinose transferase-like glycosyltransferase
VAHRPGRAALFAVVGLSFCVSLALAFTIPLVDPDEGRNAEIAREMAVDGDLVIPHLAGMPYLDKPPALFWAAAAVIRAVGPRRWAPRLPAALAAVCTLLALAALARRLGGDGLAWRSAALLATAPLFAVMAAYVIFDMPLALSVTLVWTLLARELAEGPSRARRAGMFLAVALGVLVKGPVMLAWALGGSAATALLARRRAALAWLAWWQGWVIVLGTAGLWFALACARHPEYPRYAFFEETFERMTTQSFHRDQPWWFAFVTLAVGALPWSIVTPWSPARIRRAAAECSRAGNGSHGAGRSEVEYAATPLVALGFVLFALVFFTVSHSKLVTYLLPAVPPLALLAALAWGSVRGRARVVFPLLLAVTPALLVFGGKHMHDAATATSGDPLARAIMAGTSPRPGAPVVRYEGCYSPGTDYLLGRRAVVVTPRADQTTSVYQARYRETLEQRGLWTLLHDATHAPPADVIVRPSREGRPQIPQYVEFFGDRRFTAYRRVPAPTGERAVRSGAGDRPPATQE